METFNIKRFGNTCSRLLLLRKKEYINCFLGMTLGYAFTCIMVNEPFDLTARIDEAYKTAFYHTGSLIAVITYIVIILSGSLIISDLKTKQQKIDELMLPATNFEKFTARFLGSTIFIVLTVAAAFLVGDVLQMLINMLLHKGTFASTLLIAKDMLMETKEFYATAEESSTTESLLYLFFTTNAAYILGGMLFRKTATLKTSVAIIVLGIALSSLFIGYGYAVCCYTDYVVYIPEWAQNNPWLILGLGIIKVSVFYYLAYRIYCKLQAVNTRWLNI